MNSLPNAIKDEVASMPEYSYGVNRVSVELDDGQVFKHVFIGWGEDIIKVGDSEDIPFDPARVVKVVNTA